MKRWYFLTIAALASVLVPAVMLESVIYSRVLAIAGLCLLLWLSEIVPPFVPTLLLWSLIPILLGPLDDGKFSLSNVLSWAVDPVIALFFGGFVLGAATQAQGLDKRLADFALSSSKGSFGRLLLFVIGATAFLSMWMSNIAAAALVFAGLQSILSAFDEDHILRRTLLIGVALGADLGGMATPIGTGPNAIAIAAISPTQQISFVSWMAFALPLTVGMLALSYFFLLWRSNGFRSSGVGSLPTQTIMLVEERSPEGSKRIGFIAILVATIALWLTEPIHGVPAAVIALGVSAAIFISRVLSKRDLVKIDWSTLLLIAGGITLGRLLEQSSILKSLAAHAPFADLHPALGLFLLCLTSAILSALMSNTATAVLVIPLAMALIPSPSTAILVAISASFGIPFIISTPPNAMAFGQGGLKVTDMLWPGLVLMILGCAFVSLTGPAFLRQVGIP